MRVWRPRTAFRKQKHRIYKQRWRKRFKSAGTRDSHEQEWWSDSSSTLVGWSRRLPMYGRIRREHTKRMDRSDFYYLELPHEWQKLQPDLISVVRRACRGHPLLHEARSRVWRELANGGPDEVEFAWIRPLSPSGLHATLDGSRIPPERVDRTIDFEWDGDPSRLQLIPVRKRLYRTGFSPPGVNVYPLIWVVWDIRIERPYGCPHQCHISVAIYAARVHHRPDTLTDVTAALTRLELPRSRSRERGRHRERHVESVRSPSAPSLSRQLSWPAVSLERSTSQQDDDDNDNALSPRSSSLLSTLSLS